MSCDEWNVGDECQAIADMEIDRHIQDASGKFTEQVTVKAGTPGVVRVIEREAHVMHVAFEGSTETARLDHELMHNISKR